MRKKYVSKKWLSFLLVFAMVVTTFVTFMPQKVSAADVNITTSDVVIPLSEERDITVSVTFTETPDLDDLTWTLGGKPFSEWKKFVSADEDFTGDPWISLADVSLDGNTVNATLKIVTPYDEFMATANGLAGTGYADLQQRPYPRLSYFDLLGFYELAVTDGTDTATKQMKVNAYDSFHTWDEIGPAIDEIIAMASTKSDRYFEYTTIGTSVDGRDMPFVIVAKDKAAVDNYLENTKVTALNNPQEYIDKIEAGTMGEYQVPIYINNIHPDESPGVDAQIDYLKLLATEDIITFMKDEETEVDLEVTDILDDVILVFTLTENPDGRYYNTRANVNGFDLNRDNGYQTQQEAQCITASIAEWNPLAFLDLHGFVNNFLIEPCTPPHEANFEYDLLMGGLPSDFPEFGTIGAAGMFGNAGAIGDAAIANTLYDHYFHPYYGYGYGWDDGCIAYTAVFAMMYGALGHTIEMPDSNQMSNDAVVAGLLGSTNYIMENKDVLYTNQLNVFLRGINNEDNSNVDAWHVDPLGNVIGRGEDDENYFPEYYILPVDNDLQKNSLEVYNIVEYFLRNEMQIEKTTEEVVFDGVTYPVGTYVAPLRQAKRGLVNSVLSVGVDESAWDDMYAELVMNFPAMRGFDTVIVREEGLFDGKTSVVSEAVTPCTVVEEKARNYVIENNSNDATKAVNTLLSKRKDVYMITGDSDKYDEGDFIVSKATLNAVKKDYLLRVSALDEQVTVKKLLEPMVGTGATDDQAAWVLNELGFNLVEDEYANVIVDSTGRADADAVDAGTPYVGIGRLATYFVADELLPGLVAETARRGSSNEGLLNGSYSQDNEITGVYSEDDFMYISEGTVITEVPDTTEILAQISAEDDFFIEGWWPEQEIAKGQIFGIKDESDSKDITLFAGNLTKKAHAQNLYRLLSNAIYTGVAEDEEVEIGENTVIPKFRRYRNKNYGNGNNGNGKSK